MRPYGTFDTKTGRPEEFPDKGDLLRDGRPSHGGRSEIARSSRVRRSVRRTLNRRTRAAARVEIRNY